MQFNKGNNVKSICVFRSLERAQSPRKHARAASDDARAEWRAQFSDRRARARTRTFPAPIVCVPVDSPFAYPFQFLERASSNPHVCEDRSDGLAMIDERRGGNDRERLHKDIVRTSSSFPLPADCAASIKRCASRNETLCNGGLSITAVNSFLRRARSA